MRSRLIGLGVWSVALIGGIAALGLASCSDNGGGSDDKTARGGAAGASSGSGGDWYSGFGGEAGVSGTVKPPECDASAVDDPDVGALDSNCDGIDGDVKNAIFVSPLGLDEDPGTMDQPVETLGHAIELATENGLDVYVCSATYEENVVIETVGVRIFGGFACEDGWNRTKKRAEVVPPTGVALTIRGANTPVHIEDVNFQAPNAAALEESSIAARVIDSPDVVMSHVDLIAGDGGPGTDGTEAEDYTTAPPKAPDGKTATLPSGGCYSYGAAPASCMAACSGLQFCCGYTASSCPNDCRPQMLKSACTGVVSGIAGTAPTLPACEIEGGTKSRSFALGGDGGNGFVSPTISPKNGTNPADPTGAGKDGADGTAGQEGFGELTLEGEYLPTNRGTDGKYGNIGNPGSGGKGGDATYKTGDIFPPQLGGAGGRGGAGGCGGRPGRGGGAGGASIALIVVGSGVQLERVVLKTGAGGTGGIPTDGGDGQPAGQPGTGGKSTGSYPAANGTAGTAGGQGGAGGPGAGGPSIGILALGTEPTRMATTFDTGIGGKGAAAITGSGVANGANGLSEDIYVVEPAAP